MASDTDDIEQNIENVSINFITKWFISIKSS